VFWSVLSVDVLVSLWTATKLNSKHGLQLTIDEKKKLAPTFYLLGKNEAEIADVLAVSITSVSNWVKNVKDKIEEAQKQKIVELYLQCLTQQEIANKIGLTQGRIAQIINNFKDEKINNPPILESGGQCLLWLILVLF